MAGSWINLFTSSLIYGSPIGISTHPLIASSMSPNVDRPITNHSNVLGSPSHIIYKYSNEFDSYCLIVFYFCLSVPFCIPFLVCYFCFFSLDSSHPHDSSPSCCYCSYPFVMLISPPMTPIDLLLFYSNSSDFSYFYYIFSHHHT